MKCTFHYNGPTVGVVTRVRIIHVCLSVQSIKVTMASVVMEYGAHTTTATLTDEPNTSRSGTVIT